MSATSIATLSLLHPCHKPQPHLLSASGCQELQFRTFPWFSSPSTSFNRNSSSCAHSFLPAKEMRILGWMHRKLRLNSGDPLKDFNIGRNSKEECRPSLSRAARNYSDHHCAVCLKEPFNGTGMEKTKDQEEDTLSDLFTHWHRGLLAIGTLGVDPVEPISDPPENEPDQTIKDAISLLENFADEECPKDEAPEECHVTVNPKDLTLDEGVKPHTRIQLVQDPRPPVDAFRSRVDKDPVEKKSRVSLGELFSKNKAADGNRQPENKTGKIEVAKAVHLVKNILKRRTGSSKSSGSAAGGNKIHKLFHMFNRKVHPSDYCATATTTIATVAATATAATKESTKADIIKHAKDNDVVGGKDFLIHADPTIAKEKAWQCKSHFYTADFHISGSDSNGNREHWIRTDADYLVLEL